MDRSIVNIKSEQIRMNKDSTIEKYQKEIAYLTSRLDDITKDLARLDLASLNLTRQKKQAVDTLTFINIMQEKVEESFTIDDLYKNFLQALTMDLSMGSSALLKINHETGKISLIASKNLSKSVIFAEPDKKISRNELLCPTFINSKSSLKPVHLWIKSVLRFPYFVWYPFSEENDGKLVLFLGNTSEDIVSNQPYSETSLDNLGALTSVILLKRDNIVKTQEILRQKEDRIDFLAEILKSSTISVIATNEIMKIIYANAATERLYGYEIHKLMGKDISLFSANPHFADIKKGILETVIQGGIWRGEMLNKRKNGELFHIYATFSRLLNKEGDFSAIVGFQEDITEIKLAEKALKESEIRFRTLFESAPDFIFILDKDGKIMEINPAVNSQSGYTKEEIAGQNLSEFLSLTSGNAFRKEFPSLIKNGKLHLEIEFICKDGSIIISNCSCIVVYDEAGKLAYIVTFFRNITDSKLAEERLKLTQKEVETKAKNIEETNTALKVLLKHQDTEKNIMEKNILSSLKILVLPYLEKIKIGASDERQKTYVNIIETNLSEITNPFINKLTESFSN